MRQISLWLLLSTLVALQSCEGATEVVSGDGGGDSTSDVRGDSLDGDDGDDGDADVADGGGSVIGPGPLTVVFSHVELLLDRICDLDGDGLEDNAIADLGPPHSTMFAAAVNSPIAAGIEEGERFLLHFPWIDELGGPTTGGATMVIFEGDDTEEEAAGGVNLEDDFSGGEPYHIKLKELDECGEPIHYFRDVQLDEGRITGSDGTTPLIGVDGASLRGARVSGTITPGGASADLRLCGYALVADLGTVTSLSLASGQSLLEVFVGGGAVLGVPTIHGINPDVDLDGDGFERVVLDGDLEVSHCIDGDFTVIPGADCWQDPRIADAFSLVMAFEGVSAVFAGRELHWEERIGDGCDGEIPPVPSLLDPPTEDP